MGSRIDYMAVTSGGDLKQIVNELPDGTADLRVGHVNNENLKVRDGFETINTDRWDIVTGSGDVLELAGNTQGAGYLKISKSVDQEDTETVLTSKFMVDSPVRLGLGMSLSQRLAGQRFSFSIVGVDKAGNVVSEVSIGAPIALASVSQTTTTLTVTTATPHNLVPNDRIIIYGVSDSRANYGEVLVATVTSPTVLTVTATPSATIQSVTIGTVNGSGFIQKVDPFLGANNGLGIFWEGTSASNAKMISRSNKSSLYNTADTSLGSNHTNATQSNTQNFADAWNPSYIYDIRYKAESVIARTLPLDSVNAQGGILKRSQVIPDLATGYKVRIRARNNKAMTRPIAKIVNAVKAASTTATITTDVPHGLTVGDYIQIYGMRDQTNFANLTAATAVASIIDATTFTIAFGASFTGNSRGGSVIKVNGGLTVSPITQTIQSIQVTGGQMTVIGSGTWAGIALGETVQLLGLVDSAAATQYPQYEGSFRVLSLSTTTMILATTLPDFGLINCGGAVFKKTDLRLHLFRAIDYTRHTVEVDGSVGNVTDLQEALPVNVANTPNVAVSSGTVTTVTTLTTAANGQTAHDSPVTGSPFRIGGRAVSANYATVGTGDASDLITTLVGALIQKPFSIPEADWQYAVTTPLSTTADAVMKAAGAAGIKNYLTGIQIDNTSTNGTEIVIKDGASVIWRSYALGTSIQNIDFPTPLRGSAATALNFACIAAGANIYVNAQGYQAP